MMKILKRHLLVIGLVILACPVLGLYRPRHRWDFEGGITVETPEPRPELDLGEDPSA